MFGVPVANSVVVVGAAGAPAMNQQIAGLTAAQLPVGTYIIVVTLTVAAAAAGVDVMDVKIAGTILGSPRFDGTGNDHPYLVMEFARQLDGTQNITVNANAAGSAGSIYKANIIATRIRG